MAPLSTPRFLVLFFAVLTFVLHSLSTHKPVWNVDEAFTAVTAGEILDGGLPYRDAVDHRAPLTSYLYAAILGLAGRHDMSALHLCFAFVTFLTALLVAAIARRLGGDRLAATATGLFFFMSCFSHPTLDLLAFHTEWPMILLSSIGILLFLRAGEASTPLTQHFAAGLCFGLASLSKQPALLDFAAVIAVTIPVRRLPCTALAGAGFVLPWILTTGYFMARGGFDDFLFYVFTYNKDFYMAVLPAGELARHAVVAVQEAVKSAGIGALAALSVLVALLRTARLAFEELEVEGRAHLLIAAVGVSSFVAATMPGRAFGHYSIQTFPSWSILAAISLHLLWDRFGRAGPGETVTPARLTDRRILTLVLFFVPMVLVMAKLVLVRYRDYRDRISFAEPSLDRLVHRIRTTTGPGDRIFVWGFWSEIYVLAMRKPGARFSYCTFVTGLIPWVNGPGPQETSRWEVPGSLDAMVADLEARKPVLIIDTSPGGHLHWRKYPPSKYPAFQALLDRDYQPEVLDATEAREFAVWRRRS